MKARETTKSRTFTFVMLWDEVAWVAGCTDYYYVAQGATPEECRDNLRDGLQITAEWAELDEEEPFDAREGTAYSVGPADVPEEFKDTDNACTFEEESAGDDKTKTYTGSVTVEWRVPTKTDLKNHRAEMQRKGLHPRAPKKGTEKRR
jgi:predicted RNase H-like HicB family nuclease